MLPWSGWTAWLRPDFVALVVLYWVHPAAAPGRLHSRRSSLGLLMDVAEGTLFGQHALAYSVLAFAGIVLHRRVRMFSLTAQIVHVIPLLLVNDLIVLGVRLLAGARVSRAIAISSAASSPARCGRSSRCCSSCRSGRAPIPTMSELNINPGVEMRDAEHELHHFRVRLGDRVDFRAGDVRRALRALLLSAGGDARPLPHARRSEPHLDPADRAQPRHHRRPQRRGARDNYSAYTLEITPSKVENLEATIDELATLVEITPARPAALQEAARREQALREPADPHPADRRGDRALRRQPLPLPRRRHARAAVPRSTRRASSSRT